MNYKILKDKLSELKQPDFRYKQIKDAFFQRGLLDYEGISNIPKALAKELQETVPALSFSVAKIDASVDRMSFKALLELKDGNRIETVFLSPLQGIWSACVSSQAGCQLGCRFCATGQGGFKRDLNAEEITDQVLFWKNFLLKNGLAGSFTNIIFMGMGEPFLNWNEVRDAIKTLIDPEFFDWSARHISVSTSGVADGIKKLAKEFPQVNLALSLIFPDNEMRSNFMPVNRKFNLDALSQAIEYYLATTNRKVILEYILFKDLNDGPDSAEKLRAFIDGIENGRKLLHVNLINYNVAVPDAEPSGPVAAKKFKNHLLRIGISVTIRKSLGAEIKGACGQLAV